MIPYLSKSRMFRPRKDLKATAAYKAVFRLACALISLLFLSTLAIPANAQSDPTECMTDAEGLYIKWKANWQSDRRDQDVIYKIERATKIPSKARQLHFVLELGAIEKAVLPHRRLSAREGKPISGFCDRISSSMHELQVPKRSSKAIQKTINHRKLSDRLSAQSREKPSQSQQAFIEYRNGEWVRGDYPTNKKTTFCSVLGKKFACLKRDKSLYRDELVDLEAKIAAIEGLEY